VATPADDTQQSAVRAMVVARGADGCVLGRPDLNIFVRVPEPGGVFVEVLQAGGTLAEATTRASEAAGEGVDGVDFLAGLSAAGLLAPGESTPGPDRGVRRIRWIEGVSPRAAAHLFGRAAWILYAVAAGFAAGLLLLRGDLRPAPEQLWWTPDPAFSLLSPSTVGT